MTRSGEGHGMNEDLAAAVLMVIAAKRYEWIIVANAGCFSSAHVVSICQTPTKDNNTLWEVHAVVTTGDVFVIRSPIHWLVTDSDNAVRIRYPEAWWQTTTYPGAFV